MAKSTTPKKQGPIRFEAIIPIGIILAVIYFYFLLFFDAHMKWALEWGAGAANGAEVNVSKFKTSFWGAYMEISGIQVTNPEKPAKNTVQLDLVRFELSWDALLRAKFVVNDARIEGIQMGAPRSSPGKVYPKPPPEPEKPGMISKLSDKAVDELKSQAAQNPLAPTVQMLSGGADPMALVQGQLQSLARTEALQAELTIKQQQWSEQLQNLPKNEKIQELQKRAQGIEIPKDIKDTAQMQKALNQIKSIAEEGQAQLKVVQDTSTQLTSEMSRFQKSIAELDQLAKKDVSDLSSKLQLGGLDPKSFAKGLFAQMVGQRLAQVQKVVNLSREYFPSKREDDKPPKITPRQRSAGQTYQFGRQNSYPLFWLKKAAISSQANPKAEYSGDIKGSLTDVTTDPPSIGRPAILKVDGNFPQQQVMGLKAQITVDHVTSRPKETLVVAVDSFPVREQALTTTDPVKLAIAAATGQSRFVAHLEGDTLKLDSNSAFSNVQYDLKAQPDTAQTVLQDILKGIPQVTVNAGIVGSWNTLQFSFDSNLGDELRKGLEKQLQAKINEARGKVQEFMDKNIKPKRDALNKNFSTVQNQMNGTLGEKKSEVEKVQKVADSKTKESQNQGQQQIQKQGEKALDELKKRFKF